LTDWKAYSILAFISNSGFVDAEYWTAQMEHSKEELRAFVGPNADYYLFSWERVDPTGGLQALRWNWPAFLITVFWLLYRRMYRWFWIASGVLFGLGAGEAIAEALLHIKTPEWVDVILHLAIAWFFGSFGTWLYYRHTVTALGWAKAHDVSPQAIANAGGVRWLWPMVLVAAIAVMLLATLLVVSAAHE